jgi:hypothetical protein
MAACVRLFCVYVVLCVGSGLEMDSSPAQGVLPTVYRIKKLKKADKVQQKNSRAIDRQIKTKMWSPSRTYVAVSFLRADKIKINT